MHNYLHKSHKQRTKNVNTSMCINLTFCNRYVSLQSISMFLILGTSYVKPVLFKNISVKLNNFSKRTGIFLFRIVAEEHI